MPKTENAMTYFLSDDKRAELIQALTRAGMEQKHAERFANVEDDMAEVDLAMRTHVLAIVECHKEREDVETMKGLAILSAFVNEASDRGLKEADFPMSLAAIIEDLTDRDEVSLQ
jgi:hypothetical protein